MKRGRGEKPAQILATPQGTGLATSLEAEGSEASEVDL